MKERYCMGCGALVDVKLGIWVPMGEGAVLLCFPCGCTVNASVTEQVRVVKQRMERERMEAVS